MKKMILVLMIAISTISFSKKEWTNNGKDYTYQMCRDDRDRPENIGIYKEDNAVLVFAPRVIDYNFTFHELIRLVEQDLEYEFIGMSSANCSVYEKYGKTILITELNGVIAMTGWGGDDRQEAMNMTVEAIRFLKK